MTCDLLSNLHADSRLKGYVMKITVLGGSGLIGSKLVDLLRQRGHEVVAASLASRVNTLTGEGLDEAFAGAQVIVDVTNTPCCEKDVLTFIYALHDSSCNSGFRVSGWHCQIGNGWTNSSLTTGAGTADCIR